jgi:hypothetical protein
MVPGDYERLLHFAINNNIELTRTRFILWSPRPARFPNRTAKSFRLSATTLARAFMSAGTHRPLSPLAGSGRSSRNTPREAPARA